MIDRTCLALALPVAVLLGSGCAPSTQPSPQVGTAHAPLTAARDDVAPVRAERIPVAFGDVRYLASLLERALVDGPARGQVRAVLVDERSGELVVFGTEAGIARVRAFLSPGVAEQAGAEEVEVIRLAHAEAQSVSHIVTPLVYGRIRIVADPALNAIVVSGDTEARARVKKLVTDLDVEAQSAARAP